MKSPLTLSAEPFSDDPGIPVQAVARREKRAIAESFGEMTVGRVPDWMDRSARRRARSFFARHTRSIGRTDVLLEESAPPIVIGAHTAAIAEIALAKKPAEPPPPPRNLARTEIGSIEGQVTDTTTYYGHPAVRIRPCHTSS